MLAQVRSGDWLAPARARNYALITLLLSAAILAGLIATSDGLVDLAGRPLGTDFSQVWAAGHLVLDGRPQDAYDWGIHYGVERLLFGPQTPFYGWHYPPMFLAVAGLLATLPYLPALALWQASTAVLALAAIRRIAARPGWLLPALGFPAVFVNLGHGHNGFLGAGLFGFGLLLIDRRPVLAGCLIGALAYKPQFGLMIPLVLIATGRWRCFTAAAASVAGLALASLALFGQETWLAFFDSLALTRHAVIEAGGTGWEKIQSIFSAARMLGAPVAAAYAAQGALLALVAVALVALWRGGCAFETKASALIAGSLLATPYALDYDLMILAPAIAFSAARGDRDGFWPWEKSLLAAVWAVPLFTRVVAMAVPVSLGLLVMAGYFAFLAWHGLAGPAEMRRCAEPA